MSHWVGKFLLYVVPPRLYGSWAGPYYKAAANALFLAGQRKLPHRPNNLGYPTHNILGKVIESHSTHSICKLIQAVLSEADGFELPPIYPCSRQMHT